MEHLLFLAHRIPYPPNKGDKIRSWHLLRQLAQRYHVHLGSFVDDVNDWQYIDTVKKVCTSTYFAALAPRQARLRSLGGLLASRPLTLDYYRNTGLQSWVSQALQSGQVSKILVFSSAMAQFVPPVPAAASPGRQIRRVIDFVDVDSDKWAQYAASKSWPMKWIYQREARKLLEYERSVAASFDASLFVSPEEAGLFRSMAPESAGKIGYFSNGVDADYFSPAHDFATPFATSEEALVFTGAMDYWPNVDAVQWFVREVLPGVRAQRPHAVFYIVGSRPTPQVQALASQPGVRVTGTVPDVRPYLAHAAAAVAPLRIARGIQNKVLEAMAMARPVVVSPQALEGIVACAGEEVLLAADAAAFIAALLRQLAQPVPGLGSRAREKVLTQYAWPAHLATVEALLEGGDTTAGPHTSTTPQASAYPQRKAAR
ncbi:TIGR03087 family PEP-CTERM/XrtA system glycosyltransferase [Janthinobacterium sp. 17J80-10]|uniref:TIGR03087 family PEP-CTERM/XrtA system glycosyltransferase n=1 Tax=Janthinobacterium sp. 17J80-10 TaxID=2497863 RepID=UPI0010058FFA|nr:TIGR03087 family PEP-CTERM/XrtA system glycosyltransferase [Janthinobacterium sp. 17J80-10]QAU35396.1 TIGR03087 family PEP-CTERM/XrtA system glycosyltransferase [Janthinobacterium sp. 17J80-10]